MISLDSLQYYYETDNKNKNKTFPKNFNKTEINNIFNDFIKIINGGKIDFSD